MSIPVQFVRIDPEEMDDALGPVVVHRTAHGWTYYCRADMITEEVAREFENIANRYTQTTISVTRPISPRSVVECRLVPADQMPTPLQPALLDVQGDKHTMYVREDLISRDFARAIEIISAEQNRYVIRLPVIAPRPYDG